MLNGQSICTVKKMIIRRAACNDNKWPTGVMKKICAPMAKVFKPNKNVNASKLINSIGW